MSSIEERENGLRSLVLRGVGWKLVSQVVLQSSRIVVAIVLARLLSPRDYGLAAMVLIISSFVIVFSDLALGAALVQRRTLTERDRSTVFWTGAATGLIFTLLGLVLSGPAAAFYGEPDVQPLFAALSLSFFVTSLATTQRALLTREMNFRSLELRLIVASLGGGIVGIAAAAAGHGAWAIIAQQLVVAVLSSVLLWILSPWRPRLVFSGASLRDLGGYSGNVFGQRLLYYLHENAGPLLIGRFIGPAGLGAFTIAYNVITMPFSRIAVPVAEVLFPAFSRMQDEPRRMAEGWFRSTRIVGAISIPALLGLIIVAPDFVVVVLGERWAEATRVIQILAWVGLLQSLQTLNSVILQARDRTGTLLRYSILFLAAHLVAFVVGLQWGIVGVAACYAISSTLVEPVYAWVTARALETSAWRFAASLAGIAQAAVLMAGGVLLARVALVEAGLGPGARLGILLVFGVAVYVACIAWRAPDLIADLRGLRLRRSAVSPAMPAPPERAASA